MSDKKAKQQGNKEVDFESLPAYKPRDFVPNDIDFGDVGEVVALYEKLLGEPVSSAEQLERFLLNRSELEAALGQYRAVLYIRMACDTDDKGRSEAYKHFIEIIQPAIEPLSDKLDSKYLAGLEKYPLNEQRYKQYNMVLRTDVKLFREENIAIQTQLSLLSQEYQALCGAMVVEFEGKKYTLPQMGKFLQENDRDVREAAWRCVAKRRLDDKERMEELFDKMLKLRCKEAANCGINNYQDYIFQQRHRFDYSPADCELFHEAVEKVVVPLLGRILEQRRQKMGVKSLRPWDTEADPQGREPLRPFDNVEEFIGGVHEIFKKVDPELGEQFGNMASLNLLDLESRQGKAPGGFQCSLPEARLPFILMNAVGTNGDLRTLLHEGGHALHTMACRDDDLVAYRHAPLEFCEVASMGMELLARNYVEQFYNKSEANRSRREHLEGIITLLPWIATIDAFQKWIYDNPAHSREQRREAWLNVRERFGGNLLDWNGLEQEHGYMWHRQLHIFLHPLYYIEYGIAQLGALQLWAQARRDYAGAVRNYRKALALGGSKSLRELFNTAGLRFDFSQNNVKPLIDDITEELATEK